jgi:hypothetical protein
MKDNPYRSKTIIWAIATLLAILVILMPDILGIYDFPGSYALSEIIAIAGFTLSIIYVLEARRLERILKADNLLAHWNYSQEEWDQYVAIEYRTVNRENRVPYYWLSASALIFVILFFLFNGRSAKWAFVFSSAFITSVLGAFVWWFCAWYTNRQNKKYLGEAYITPDAVYLNRRLETWRGLGAKLESVVVADNESQQLLVITCSNLTRYGRAEYTIRVPVPRGQEKIAMEIAEKLNAQIK